MARLDDQYVSLECPAGDITLTLAKSGNFSLVLKEWDSSRMTHTSERRLEGQWALDGDTLTLSSAIAELVYSRSTSGLNIAGKKATIDTYMWEQSSQPTFADSVALLERVALDGFLLSVTPKR